MNNKNSLSLHDQWKLILYACYQGRSPPKKGIYQCARGMGWFHGTPDTKMCLHDNRHWVLKMKLLWWPGITIVHFLIHNVIFAIKIQPCKNHSIEQTTWQNKFNQIKTKNNKLTLLTLFYAISFIHEVNNLLYCILLIK